MLQAYFYLTLMHCITDFGLQKWGIGERKYGVNRYMLAHIGISILGSFAALSLAHVQSSNTLSFLLFTGVAHLGIDMIRPALHRRLHISPNDSQFWSLLAIDQVLHLTTLYLGVQTIL